MMIASTIQLRCFQKYSKHAEWYGRIRNWYCKLRLLVYPASFDHVIQNAENLILNAVLIVVIKILDHSVLKPSLET